MSRRRASPDPRRDQPPEPPDPPVRRLVRRAHPYLAPWPGPPDPDWTRRAKLLEGYIQSCRNFEEFRSSRKRLQVVRRLSFLRRQDREVRRELYIRRREIAVVRALRGMAGVEVDETVPKEHDLSPAERLDIFLALYRKGRDRRYHPRRAHLSRVAPLLGVALFQRHGPAVLEVLAVETTLQVRKAGHRAWAWLLAHGFFLDEENPWIKAAIIPHPLDGGLNWLERHATGAILAADLDRAAGDPPRSLPLGPSHLEELEADLVRLERYEKILRQEADTLSERLALSVEFTFDPLLSASPGEEEVDLTLLFPLALCAVRKDEMSATFYADPLRPDPDRPRETSARETPAREAIGLDLEVFRNCMEFWWFALRALLWRGGGLSEEGVLAPWARDLVTGLIEHPSKFARARVPAVATKARSILTHYVAPLARMTCARHREPFRLAPQAGDDPVVFLNAAAFYLSDRGMDEELHEVPPTREAERALDALVRDVLLPISHLLLLDMARWSHETLDIPEWLYFDEYPVGAEERGGPAGAEAEPALEPEPPGRFRLPDVVRIAPALSWTYVRNPAEPAAHRDPLGRIRSSDLERVSAYFRREGISTLIKPESVLRALRYFEGMPEEIRRLLPAEIAGGHRWAKLKRGSLRILVRVTGPEVGEFYLYPRREWTRPLEYT